MLVAMREAQACCEMPCQADELQACFQDALGGAAIAKASGDSYGNAAVERGVTTALGFGAED